MKLQVTTQTHSAKSWYTEERGEEIKEKMGINWTEIAELHNDQSGFIHIEQIYIKAGSSECKSSLIIHQPLRQNRERTKRFFSLWRY